MHEDAYVDIVNDDEAIWINTYADLKSLYPIESIPITDLEKFIKLCRDYGNNENKKFANQLENFIRLWRNSSDFSNTVNDLDILLEVPMGKK